MAPAPRRRLEAPHLRPPAMGALDIACGNDPVLRMALVALTSARKVIDRFEPLDSGPVQALPVAGADQAGQGSKGEGCVFAAILAEPCEAGTCPEAEQQPAAYVVAVIPRCESGPGGEAGVLSGGPGSARCGGVLVISLAVADDS